MGHPETPKCLVITILIGIGVFTVLFAASAIGTYFIYAGIPDVQVGCLNEECLTTTVSNPGGKSVPESNYACRSPSSTVFDHQVECISNSCWQFGPSDRFNAQCVNGYCQCNSTFYSQECLPCVGECHIKESDKDSRQLHATPRSSYTTVYSCIGEKGNYDDVHVLGVYENINKRPPTAGIINVHISASSSRPVILVLTNYEPVNWVLNFITSINVKKIILFAYYSDLSSVTVANGVAQPFTEKRPRGTPGGFGDDSGGGDTAGMLADLHAEFGAVTSFAGAYQADSWTWNLPTADARDSTEIPTKVTSQKASTLSYVEDPILCWEDSCWHVGPPEQFDAQCVNGLCECNAPLYDRTTCLPSVSSCHVRKNSPQLHAMSYSSTSSDPTVFSCIGHGGTNADVHVLGVYEGNVNTRPPSAGIMNVKITSSPTSTRPVVLVLTNYEPVGWILDFPSYLNIEKVILIAYYSDLSSVTPSISTSGSFVVDKRPRGTPWGYGSDNGGGNTAEMLLDLQNEFGAVTSLAGTYQADSWIWNLPNEDNMIHPTPVPATMSNDDTLVVTTNSWTRYTFYFDDNWNSCHGDQYVRIRPISSDEVGRYIGVILCTSNRYKLLMADDLQDQFKNIADGNGHGQDHCEFVGATSEGIADSNFWESPLAIGYYRHNWGEEVTRGTIGGGTGESSTGKYYPTWYECGVSIP